MPIITFASAKGGAGKTTSAIILATEIAQHTKVYVIDADPSGFHFAEWSEAGGATKDITVIRSRGENHIQDEIAHGVKIAPWVIVDLEGGKSRANAYAMAASDLVIVSTQAEVPDVRSAVDTVAQIKLEERHLRRSIPYAIQFNRTQVTATPRIMREILESVGTDAHALAVHLNRRTAFSHLHKTGTGLRELSNSVGGRKQAIENAAASAQEIVEYLEESRNAKTA